MCNLYSITTNQAAISALFRVVNRYVGNLPPMPGVFPDYAAPIVRTAPKAAKLVTARWGMPSSQNGADGGHQEARRESSRPRARPSTSTNCSGWSPTAAPPTFAT